MAIPMVLLFFVRRRRDLPFPSIFLLFGIFILSCGFTHFMEVFVTYTPLYWLAGLVKVVTALASWATVFALVPVAPKVLTLRSTAELQRSVEERTTELVQANSALHREIGERRHVEEALRESDQRKDEFLAVLAHELRNPLAPIRNALQVLRVRGHDASSLEQARGLMERQMEQLVRLVDDLLDVSRINRGMIQLHKEPVLLESVVARAVETAQPLMDVQRNRLFLNLPSEPVLLEVDLTRLAQVLANLLNNAVRYTEPGGQIWLSAEVEGEESAARKLVMRVKDNGIGIRPEVLPHIFDLFTQADRSLERSRGGLGIGLTVVRKLVAMHGGTVEACSAGPGQGSEFIVRLPLGEAAPSAPQTDTTEPGSRAAQGGSRRILVVDDNTDSAESLAMLLRLQENDVQIAYDGPSAVETARTFRPDVVLLDIGMPGMNGYEVCRRLRADPDVNRALIIAQTGWGQAEDRRRSQEAGFDHHLVKPVDPVVLHELLATAPTGGQVTA